MQARQHEAFFCELLNCFPAHLVLPPTEQEEETAAARYHHHRKVALPKDEKKKAAKEGKRARFQPENQLSVDRMQDVRQRVDAPTAPNDDAGVERNSYNALRDRLQKRISDFRSKRNTKSSGPGGGRANRRGDKAGHAGAEDDRPSRSNRPGGGNLRKGEGRDGGSDERAAAEDQQPQKAAVEDTGDIQLSMLELGTSQQRKKTPAPGSKTRKLQSMLETVKQKEARLQELRQSDADQAQGEQWKDVLKIASGERVADDAARLKRALKSRESAKKKSAKKWDKLNKDVARQKAAKQQKRTENLKKRAGQLPKDEPTAKKRRQSGAGFEGRKSGGDFINKNGGGGGRRD